MSTIDWGTVEGVIAGLTDAEALQLRLNQLKGATIAAEQLAQLKARYETADKLRAEGAAMLARASAMQTEAARARDALQPREARLDERERRVAAREEACAVRECQAEGRLRDLQEIAKRAAEAA